MMGFRQVSEVLNSMRSHIAVLAFALAMTVPVAADASGVSLQWVAAKDGYTMRWLGPERSVCLSRNGTVVVLRPGSVLYDVNSHEELADVPPIPAGSGDLSISKALATRLTAIAAQSTSADPAPTGRAYVPVLVASQGSIVVSAQVITGRHALSVEGIAPRNARVTLTMFATLAPDLPTVFLRRNDLQADISGRFAAVVPLAPDYFTGSTVTLYATSEGVQSGATRVVLDGAL
jgi:hypothetical protein